MAGRQTATKGTRSKGAMQTPRGGPDDDRLIKLGELGY